MLNIIRSDFYKIKHTWLPWVYVMVPLLYVLLIYAAYLFTGMSRLSKEDITKSYLEILGAAFPVVIGFITAKVIDMEAEAGHFQIMLTGVSSRVKSYLGKLLSLILCALFSVMLTQIFFAVCFRNHSMYELFIELLLIMAGCLPLYLIHIWVSLQFGGGASIGLGVLETLSAFLFMSNIGDAIWYYFPASWSSRLCVSYLLRNTVPDKTFFSGEFIKWSVTAIPIVLILLTGSLIWFYFWDGRTSIE